MVAAAAAGGAPPAPPHEDCYAPLRGNRSLVSFDVAWRGLERMAIGESFVAAGGAGWRAPLQCYFPGDARGMCTEHMNEVGGSERDVRSVRISSLHTWP